MFFDRQFKIRRLDLRENSLISRKVYLINADPKFGEDNLYEH